MPQPVCSNIHIVYSLQALLDKLAAMESELAANTAKKERLEAEIALCSVKLERAVRVTRHLTCVYDHTVCMQPPSPQQCC